MCVTDTATSLILLKYMLSKVKQSICSCLFPPSPIYLREAGVSGNSRSRPFSRMKAFDSHSRIMGMDFFHSLRVPELWECYFFIPFYILLKVAQYECTSCASSRLGSDDAVTNIVCLMSDLREIEQKWFLPWLGGLPSPHPSRPWWEEPPLRCLHNTDKLPAAALQQGATDSHSV